MTDSNIPPRPGLELVTVAPRGSINCGDASNDFQDLRGPGETLWVEPEEAARLRALGAVIDPAAPEDVPVAALGADVPGLVKVVRSDDYPAWAPGRVETP